MKKLYLGISLILIATQFVFSQETYTVLKVSSENAPEIDGDIDDIWSNADLVQLTKNVDDGDRTTEKDPAESDYKAEFSLLWNDDGLYILTILNDDVYVNDNGAEWWKDDDVNFLIPPDLTSTGVTPLEFAWLVLDDTEGKAIPYQGIAEETVSAAWENSGTEYVLEAFVSWEAFTSTVSDDMEILFEARARDDDKDGDVIYPQSFLQWSTDQKTVESDGIGLGTLTLSSEEANMASSLAGQSNDIILKAFPNPAATILFVDVENTLTGIAQVSVLDLTGRQIFTVDVENKLTNEPFSLDVSNLKTGVYILRVENEIVQTQQKFCILRD